MKNKLAFTLIELLVVIAIIGILSSIVLASLSGARSSARDVQRIQAIDQIKTALEMHYNDKGRYPNQSDDGVYHFSYSEIGALCGYEGSGSYDAWCSTNNGNGLEKALSPYIDKLPRAKTFNNEEYLYKYNEPRNIYGLWAKLEEPTEASRNDGGYYDDRYEVGQLPSYCMNKYTGSDRRWDNWSGGDSCVGGN